MRKGDKRRFRATCRLVRADAARGEGDGARIEAALVPFQAGQAVGILGLRLAREATWRTTAPCYDSA